MTPQLGVGLELLEIKFEEVVTNGVFCAFVESSWFQHVG